MSEDRKIQVVKKGLAQNEKNGKVQDDRQRELQKIRYELLREAERNKATLNKLAKRVEDLTIMS